MTFKKKKGMETFVDEVDKRQHTQCMGFRISFEQANHKKIFLRQLEKIKHSSSIG